jgi:hypothetical protein
MYTNQYINPTKTRTQFTGSQKKYTFYGFLPLVTLFNTNKNNMASTRIHLYLTIPEHMKKKNKKCPIFVLGFIIVVCYSLALELSNN